MPQVEGDRLRVHARSDHQTRARVARLVEAPRIVGEVRAEPEGFVLLQTGFGGSRVVDMFV